MICSNGLKDPWSSGGVVKSISDSVISVLIPEGAHHLDLRGSNPLDPASVVDARQKHRTNIQKWINQASAKPTLSNGIEAGLEIRDINSSLKDRNSVMIEILP